MEFGLTQWVTNVARVSFCADVAGVADVVFIYMVFGGGVQCDNYGPVYLHYYITWAVLYYTALFVTLYCIIVRRGNQ